MVSVALKVKSVLLAPYLSFLCLSLKAYIFVIGTLIGLLRVVCMVCGLGATIKGEGWWVCGVLCIYESCCGL